MVLIPDRKGIPWTFFDPILLHTQPESPKTMSILLLSVGRSGRIPRSGTLHRLGLIFDLGRPFKGLYRNKVIIFKMEEFKS